MRGAFSVSSVMRLADRVIIVAGVSPNIGGGIIDGLVAEGAAVVAVDLSAENVEQCAAHVQSKGGRALGIAADVSSEEAVAAAVRDTLETFGRVDGLVNNAALFNRKSILDMPLDQWRLQLQVILDGTFLFTKYAARAMIDGGRGGAMVNIISTAGHQGEPGNIAYTTAKAGLLNFTRAAAMEFAARNIRVNSLTPTATDPYESVERARAWGREMTLPANIDAVMAPFADGIPMNRLPKPSDYAAAAAFLLSDDARMITGTDLRVDGGAVARYWAWHPRSDWI
jgi:NAD(P)-dependent dehydrogenase (short-subunit alcohol dehydrogenase family)